MPTLDPRSLKPAQLARLLNSTPLGEVIMPREVYRQRDRAGYRIGDGSTIDLVRYVAWLLRQRHDRANRPTTATYGDVKERARERAARMSREGRSIGDIPRVADPDRRDEATGSFRAFCESYFPATFFLPWCDDHLKVIGKIEQAVTHGGLFALAMPRASGKTVLAQRACLWAILTGAREFVCLIGSDEGHAVHMLDGIKVELECNDLLQEDFPEAVSPIRCLEGIANRCAGQLYAGERTHIEWTAKEIVMPSLSPQEEWWQRPENARFLREDGRTLASGAILKVAGVTGRIRGMTHQRPDGRTARPSLVVIDDPQTDESARSLSQCQAREPCRSGPRPGRTGQEDQRHHAVHGHQAR